MGMQIAGLGNLFLTARNANAPAVTPPTPAAFAAMSVDQQIAYLASVSADTPPFAVLGDPGAQVLATVAADNKSVTVGGVPASYSAALAGGPSPSASDFQAWAGPLQLSYLRQAGGPTQSLTLFSGTVGFTAAVNAAGTGADVVQQIGGLGTFWSTTTVAATAASTPAATATGALPMIVTPGALSTTGLADNVVPYANLSGGVTGLDSVNQTVAGILFPVLNGDPTVAGSTILPTDPQTAADKQLVADFNTPPASLDANTFGAWNSAVQLQYLRANDPRNQGLAIGIPNSADGVLHAFMSAPTVPQLLPQKVYVVENIQKQDISTMALADQKVLAGLSAFQQIAQSLGLIPDGIDRGVDGIHALDSAQAGTFIAGQFATALATIDDPSKGVPSINKTPGAMPDADVQVFKDELTLIQTQAAGSAIFSPKDIQDKINAVITRFQRAYAFGITANASSYAMPLVDISADEENSSSGNSSARYHPDDGTLTSYLNYWNLPANQSFYTPIYDPTTKTYSLPPGAPAGITLEINHGYSDQINRPDGSVTVHFGAGPSSGVFGQDFDPLNISGAARGGNVHIYDATFTLKQQLSNTDQDAGIKSGYNVFLTQEKAILAQSNRAQALASNTSGTQNLDVPNLVYLFQLYTNLTGEATLRADTEQVNQTNAQLQTYAVMQRIINQTVAKIGSSTDGHGLVGSADAAGGFTPEEQSALDIFDSRAGTPPQSPIELLQGIHRPTVNTLASNSQTGPSWSQFGTELSDTVTLLNQNSQLKMNDINAETKQKDRNFDLANSALSKMNDILSKIASSIG